MQQVKVKNETPNKKSYTKLWFHAPNMTIIPMVTCPTVMHIQVYNGHLRVTVRVPPLEEMHQSEWQDQTNGYMKGCW